MLQFWNDVTYFLILKKTQEHKSYHNYRSYFVLDYFIADFMTVEVNMGELWMLLS